MPALRPADRVGVPRHLLVVLVPGRRPAGSATPQERGEGIITDALNHRFKDLLVAARQLQAALDQADRGATTEATRALAALELADMANRLLAAADRITGGCAGQVGDVTFKEI